MSLCYVHFSVFFREKIRMALASGSGKYSFISIYKYLLIKKVSSFVAGMPIRVGVPIEENPLKLFCLFLVSVFFVACASSEFQKSGLIPGKDEEEPPPTESVEAADIPPNNSEGEGNDSSSNGKIEKEDEASLPSNIAGAFLRLYTVKEPSEDQLHGSYWVRLEDDSNNKSNLSVEDISVSENSLGVGVELVRLEASEPYHARVDFKGAVLDDIVRVMKSSLITFSVKVNENQPATVTSVRGKDQEKDLFPENSGVTSEPH